MNTESSVQPSSSFTDIFIRRPVLAIVVNLVIIIAGPSGDPHAERPPVPAERERDGHRDHGLRRRQRRSGARLHHHAARARDRRGRRHRLHRIAERPGPVDDQRPAQAELRRRPRRSPTSARGRPGARRSAARGRGAGHQDRAVGRAVRGHVLELRLRDPRGEPGHRLPDPRRAAAALGASRACSAPTSSGAAPSPCASG